MPLRRPPAHRHALAHLTPLHKLTSLPPLPCSQPLQSIDVSSNSTAALAGYIAGASSNTSVAGRVTFPSLRVRAPPGAYVLPFTAATVASASGGYSYAGVNVTVTVNA